MRLVTYASAEHSAARVGALLNDGRVLDLRGASERVLLDEGAPADVAARSAADAVPASMEAFVAGGRPCLEAARRALRAGGGAAGVEAGRVQLLAPLRPASIRDVVGFEDHARAGAERRGAALPPAWGERPFWYRGNHRAILGPGEPLAVPAFTNELDFELEVACIVGRELRDVTEDEAGEAIFGYTIMNDWSARDLQGAEMESRMGPSKSKDFATSFGPCILVAEPGRQPPALAMTAAVNGRTVCEANLGDARWTFPAVLAFAARGETIHPGDVFGSGTPFGGCLLDHGGPWLRPGDTVELAVERIGVLRTRVT